MYAMLEKYRDYLPLTSEAKSVSLGEGATPLVPAAERESLYFKLEQLNPTGSFKDRFAALEITLLKQAKVTACPKICIATSSGNTGAALAAYAARHGLRCLLFVNEIAPVNKLAQLSVYGAEVFRVRGFGVTPEATAAIFQQLEALAAAVNTRLSVSAYAYSPDGMEGLKTIAYELVEQLGAAPQHVFAPVGGGGLLTALWRGFGDLRERGLIERLPQMHAVQPALNDTIITPLLKGQTTAQSCATTTTISGLAVQIDLDATRALRAVQASGGTGWLVAEDDIRTAQQQLARQGLFVEPAGATAYAGYLQARLPANESAVCLLTGHGLKDMAMEASTTFINAADITPALLERNA